MAPRFVFRAGPVPFSIKLAAGLAVTFQIAGARMLMPTTAKFAADPQPVLVALIWIALVGWGVYAALRLSRLPLVVLTIATVASLFWKAHEPSMLFGCMAPAWLLCLILILPHWRRLNWRPFGRLPTVADVAENFT